MSSIANLPDQVHRALSALSDDEPYPRFIIDDVLESTEYETLLGSFPDHLVGDPGADGFVNYTIRPHMSADERLSPEWQNFVTTIRAPETKAALVRACLGEATRRYPAWWRWLLRSRLANPDNYEINLAFSANYAGRYLPPHTDNSYKVLALVLYFAPRGYEGFEEGTRFFRHMSRAALRKAIKRFNRLSDSKLTRFAPFEVLPMASAYIYNGATSTIAKQNNEAWFRENFENDYNISFKSNRIAGFIKTQSSFHAVDMRESTFEGPRRSILINLNLKHSLAARAWQSFRTRVLRLSS